MNANRVHLFLLGTCIPILGGLVGLFLKTLPLTLAQAIYFCQQTLSQAIVFPRVTSLIILLSLLFIFVMGLLILAVQIIKTNVFLKKSFKKKTSLPRKLVSVATVYGLEGKVTIIKDERFVSFCYGFLKPKICLSTSLIKNLTKEELEVVLLHERYHLKNFDPLRIIVSKTISQMFFFIPTLRDIDAHYAFSKEVSADMDALKNGTKESLVSALSKLLSPGVSRYNGVAAFTGTEDLERRIVYLTDHAMGSIRLSKLKLVVSLTVIAFLFLSLNASFHTMVMRGGMKTVSYICPFGDNCLFTNKHSINQSKAVNTTSLK